MKICTQAQLRNLNTSNTLNIIIIYSKQYCDKHFNQSENWDWDLKIHSKIYMYIYTLVQYQPQLIIKRKLNKNVIIQFYRDNHLWIIISNNKKPIKNNLAEDETVIDRILNSKPPNPWISSKSSEPFSRNRFYIYKCIYKNCSLNNIK